MARQPTLSRSSIAFATDFESTRKRTAKGARAANRNSADDSTPIVGVSPMINRSTSVSESEKENAPLLCGRFTTTNSRPKMRASVSRMTSDSSMTKIRFIGVSAPVVCLANRLTDRQIYEK